MVRTGLAGTSPLSAGDVLGRYQLLMPIAQGGMGQVWAARLHGTRGFQKLVAIKTILPLAEDAGLLESMLFQEASLACLVRHPNVVETLDLGECPNAALYLVMEWVHGEPLDYVLRAAGPVGGVPLPILTHLLVQGLKGLHAAHQARDARGELAGIVHRDVSLQNLLVTDEGLVKLIDFGVAKATQQMSRPTEDGMLKGKFAYMSPEQLRSEPLDARADVFAMGICVYRATTGVHPFRSENAAATLRRILMEDPPRPTGVAAGYPRALEGVVMKALQKDRSARFQSAQEMMVALEGAVPEAARAECASESAAFLRRLLAPRTSERTAALQAALKAADDDPAARLSLGGLKAGEGAKSPRSLSTMRAVSLAAATEVEAAGDAPSEDDAPTPLASVRPAGSPGTRWAVGALAVSVVAAAALGVMARPPRGIRSAPAESVPRAAHAPALILPEAIPAEAPGDPRGAPLAPTAVLPKAAAPGEPAAAASARAPQAPAPRKHARASDRPDPTAAARPLLPPAEPRPAAAPEGASSAGAVEGADPLSRRK